MAAMENRRQVARAGILERPLVKPRSEVSLSAFAFLFSEIVQYFQNRVDSVSDLEKKLEELGYGVGLRMVELISIKDRATKRETRLINMLQYLSSTVWKHLFHKVADNLERSNENEDEYMIYENSAITNTFVSVPSDMSTFNGASYLGGIIKGVLDSASFTCKVTAHTISAEEQPPPAANTPGGVPTLALDKTVFLIKFAPEVMARERQFS